MFLAATAVLAFYGAIVVISVAIAFVLPDAPLATPEGLLLGALPVVVAGLIVNAFLVRRGWSRWSTLGWPEPARGVRAFGWGAGIGVAMALGAILLAAARGEAGVEFTGEPVGAYLRVLFVVGLGLVLAALGEELVFRGYPLVRLSRSVGKIPASLALAALFAAVHVPNPAVSTLGLVNIGLASLVLSAAFFTPGGLPAAWGVHAGWNSGLGLLVDAPVSGIALEVPAVEFRAGGPTWVTGGAFGPEGGLVATVVMVAAMLLLSRWAARAVKEPRQ